MIYTITLFLSLILCWYNDSNKNNHRYSISIGYCIILWTILIGGQYNVGTDYDSYYEIFTDSDALNLYYSKGEYLFFYLVHSLNRIGINGQQIFIVIALLNSVLLFKILSYIDKKNTFLFVFLFITVSTVFHNQMNGIRQYMAVYLITLMIILLLRKRFFISALLLIASYYLHNSALLLVLFIPFLLIMTNKVRNTKLILSLLLIASVISLFSFEEKVKEFLYLFSEYQHYAESDYLKDISFKGKVTKLIFVPIYIYALLSVYKSGKLNNYESNLFLVGIYSYIIKTLFLVTSLTNRLGFYFLILSILPLFFLLKHLMYKRTASIFTILLYVFLFQYLVKVVLFPVGEYSYASCYFQWLL